MRSDHKFIFIGGAHRSGTTLVQRIMGTHSEVFAGREFDFTKEIIALRARLLDAYDSGRVADLVHREDIDHAVEEFTAALFERTLKRTKKSILCEKTPSNAFVMGELCDSMINAYCILVLRDPRAVVASMKKVADKYYAVGLRPPPFCASVAASIKDINETWRIGLEAMSGRDRIMIVYYEDLISEPEKVVKSLCRFTGLTYEPKMIQPKPLEDRHTHLSDQFWYTKAELARPITVRNHDNYTTVLSRIQISLVERYVLRHPALARYEMGGTTASFWERLTMAYEQLKAAKFFQKIQATIKTNK